MILVYLAAASPQVTLTPSLVSAYAEGAGDTNPVHHDARFAAATRYGRPIASGKPGPVTMRLQQTFLSIVRGHDPKYLNWLTPVEAA